MLCKRCTLKTFDEDLILGVLVTQLPHSAAFADVCNVCNFGIVHKMSPRPHSTPEWFVKVDSGLDRGG